MTTSLSVCAQELAKYGAAFRGGQRLGIPSFCGAVAGAMRLLCSDDAGFKSAAARHAQAANQGEFALQYLRNQ